MNTNGTNGLRQRLERVERAAIGPPPSPTLTVERYTDNTGTKCVALKFGKLTVAYLAADLWDSL